MYVVLNMKDVTPYQPLIIHLYTVAAPLIAALDYRPLLNRGRKNWGLKNIF